MARAPMTRTAERTSESTRRIWTDNLSQDGRRIRSNGHGYKPMRECNPAGTAEENRSANSRVAIVLSRKFYLRMTLGLFSEGPSKGTVGFHVFG